MEMFFNFIKGILDLGAVVMLPIVIFILGAFFRMKIGAAIKSGLFVGIGFQGLVLALGLLTTTIKPVIEYYKAAGSGFTTLDIGFAAIGGASWSVPFAALSVPLIIGINLLLIKLKLTKVMNVDVWNFIHFLTPGALAYALFDSFWIGLAVTLILSVVVLFFAQWAAPKWGEFFGLEGTTCTTLSFVALYYPIGILFNKIIDLIPGVNKIEVDISKIESKLGFFGEPALIGVIIGGLLGIITKQSPGTALMVGMGIAAVLVLIPRMVAIMMEGITPIGNAASAYMKKKIGNDSEIYIGMDIALGLGDPACITTTVVTIPFVILMAFIIPGMTYFPLGLLGEVCYLTPMIVLASKGNLFRSIVVTITCMFIVVFCANIFAPEATAMMNVTGVPVDGMVTASHFGWNPGNIIISIISRLLHLS